MKRMVLFVVAVAATLAAFGADDKKLSARDIFGISVDEPVPDYIRPADTNGTISVDDHRGNHCIGRGFCEIIPLGFEVGAPDARGRSMIRSVRAEMPMASRTKAEWVFTKAASRLEDAPNLKQYGKMKKSGEGSWNAEWYGSGPDGVPFAVTLSLEDNFAGRSSVKCLVMDFELYAGDGKHQGLPKLGDVDRERRLERLEKLRAARCAKMMRDKAYSGTWACKAKGYERIAFCFDKSGLGCFDVIVDGFMVSHPAAAGWFYWTADDNGVISIHASPKNDKASEFTFRYDSKRNTMIPELGAYPFTERVMTDKDNPQCEMKFINDFTAAEAAMKIRSRRSPMSEREERIKKMERRVVASFDALCGLILQLGKERGGVLIRGDGCPDITVASTSQYVGFSVDLEIWRGGLQNAPRFECITEKGGPDIAGKKEHEIFFGKEELAKLAGLQVNKVQADTFEDEGVWSWEKRSVSWILFKGREWDMYSAALKPVMDKWYKFPVKVFILK